MKITQIFKIYWPDNGGGIANVMENIAGAFPDCRQEIIVCQNQRKKKSTDDLYKGIWVHRCRQLFELASTPVSFDFLREVKQRTSDSDFVIYHFPYPMADLAILLGMYSGRLIVWWHCGFEQYKKLAFFYRPLVNHTLKKAGLILVSSQGNLIHSALLRKYRGKCRVIPFCVNEAYIQRGKESRASDCVHKSQITILFIGRLVWYKGCNILLKAFAKMQEDVKLPCRLVLVGSGPLEKELKRLSASLHLKHVLFTGMVSEDEKMKWLERCDFLVLPSVSEAEAFAVVQIEAMAFGKPVINTRLPSGVPYVSLDGVTGKTVTPGNIHELAAAMQELAENGCLRKRYGENARKRVQEKYTQQAMAETYRKVFSQLQPANAASGMKIAFDAQLFLGGDKTGIAWNAHNLIKELLKYTEHEYTLQCMKGRRAAGQLYRLSEYQKAGCRIEYCSKCSYTLYKLLWILFPVPHRLFFRANSDITQFFNYAVPPGASGKQVTFIYDMAYKACPWTMHPKTRIWLELCMKKTCRHAAHIVTVSNFSRHEILKYLDIPKEQVSVVPCAVDHTAYHPHYSKAQIQKVLDRLGIEPDYMLYVGTIEPRKNLERLIGAYAKLCRLKKHVPQLVLAGKKGWLCEGIYQKVQRLGLENRVLFTGYIRQEDSPVLMCGAKAFVFPSLYEGFGMPPLEAMACGAPVITSNTTALQEVAGDAAITINPESENEIYRAMKMVLENTTYSKQLREKGIKRASAYTWAKSAAMLLEVYRRIRK